MTAREAPHQRRPWAALPSELLSCVAERFHTPRCYPAARGACTAWRSAVPPAPPAPCLLVVSAASGDGAPRVSAHSFPPRRAFHLATLRAGDSCVGSSDDGWLAVLPDSGGSSPYVMCGTRVCLLNPATGQQIPVPLRRPPRTADSASVCKIAFAPNPRRDDLTMLATYEAKSLLYVAVRSAAPCRFHEIAVPGVRADLVYHDGGDGDGGKFYCLTQDGNVHVLRVPRGRPAPAPVLEPLLPGGPLAGADLFSPGYARACDLLRDKQLVFCEGGLYQVWRNTMGSGVRWRVPGGDDMFTVSRNGVFVLRHDPARRPCWEPVKDLGGCSVFVGASNAVSARAGGVPGIKGDCVYTVNRSAEDRAVVFDMKTRSWSPCHAPPSAGGLPVGWYSFGRPGEQ